MDSVADSSARHALRQDLVEPTVPLSSSSDELATSSDPRTLLRQVATVLLDPPCSEILKLYFAARRLHADDHWSRLEVFLHTASNSWALRGEHFNESFDSCCAEVVVPLDAHDHITLAGHDRLAQQIGLRHIYYALIDAGGDVVLYAFCQSPHLAPPSKRPLSEPSFVPPSVLEAACDAQKQGGVAKGRSKPSKRQASSDGNASRKKKRAALPNPLDTVAVDAGAKTI